MTDNFENFTANQARGYASTVTRIAKELAPNNHIKASIRSTVEIGQQGKFIIRVRASGPDARAREYGSGVWARRGPKGKILIRPKNYPLLVFKWDVATSPISNGSVNVPRNAEGFVHLKQVEHPGVDAANEGKGYIHPAINQTNKYIRDKFATEGKEAIKLDIRASFKGAK
jgi:hypothetical protein